MDFITSPSPQTLALPFAPSAIFQDFPFLYGAVGKVRVR